MKTYGHLKLKVVEGQFKYVLFNTSESFMEISNSHLENPDKPFAVFAGNGEFSAIIPSSLDTPGSEKEEDEWSCLKIVGEMPFGTVQGLIATISSSLKNDGLGICVISTYLTDWFFVRTKNLEKVIEKLTSSGWSIEE